MSNILKWLCLITSFFCLGWEGYKFYNRDKLFYNEKGTVKLIVKNPELKRVGIAIYDIESNFGMGYMPRVWETIEIDLRAGKYVVSAYLVKGEQGLHFDLDDMPYDQQRGINYVEVTRKNQTLVLNPTDFSDIY